MTNLLVAGMHGLGDNLHQRALVRQLMERHTVQLETPWPSVYHDLVGPRLKLLTKGSRLRTQAKNAAREAHLYSRERLPAARRLQVSYSPEAVRSTGSVLGAMLKSAGCDERRADFRLPIAPAWRDKAAAWLARWNPSKPLLIYRPLVERTEWGGCAARNPDASYYSELLAAIRPHYFVLSVADLEPGKEWLADHVSNRGISDVDCHRGELDFETMAALFERAALVFCSPGFAVVMAQAVGTPCVTVFGGYEDATSFSAGVHYAPWLPIEPVDPCNCFSHKHACRKRIDMPLALDRLRSFADEVTYRQPLAA